MKLFEPCYDMALRWARHRHATKYLGGLSFSESVFFPIPPDVMLAPMALSQLCAIATLSTGGLPAATRTTCTRVATPGLRGNTHRRAEAGDAQEGRSLSPECGAEESH